MDERTGAVSGSDDPLAIRRDIERTQREMSRTIEEIQHRLSPQYMMQKTKDSVREAGVRTSRSFIDKIKANPIPAAMVGIGLFLLTRDRDDDVEVEFRPEFTSGWDRDNLRYSSVAEYRDLDFEANDRGRIDEARERVSEAASHARERVSGAVDTAKERVSEAVGSARHAASDTMHNLHDRAEVFGNRARYSTRRAGVQTVDFMRDNPLAAGLVAVALGAIVGSLIPETEREHELMGGTRDRLAERARELAREGVDKAKTVATSVAGAATEAAKDAAKEATKDIRSGSTGTANKTDVGQTIGIGGTSTSGTGTNLR